MACLKLGSSLFRLIASCVFENKTSIANEDIQAVAVVKNTCVSNAIQEIINLFSNDQTEIDIFGNQDLERILMEIAERLTPRLKEANKKVARTIKKSAQ